MYLCTLDSQEKRSARNERVGKGNGRRTTLDGQPIIRFFIYVWRGFLAVVCSVTVTRIGYRLVLYLFSCNCTIHTRTCTNGYMALKNWVKPLFISYCQNYADESLLMKSKIKSDPAVSRRGWAWKVQWIKQTGCRGPKAGCRLIGRTGLVCRGFEAGCN